MPASTPQATPDHAVTEHNPPKPRRFAPEPVETTTRSSKAPDNTSPDKAKTSTVRRFAPEPSETSVKSSHNRAVEAEQNTPKPRRFAPQPVEISHKSSKDKAETKSESTRIRFKPQLVETTYSGNRLTSRRSSRASESSLNTDDEEPKTPRKFVPVVLSTARRSRRAGDPNAASHQDQKTEEGHVLHAKEHQRHAGWETPDDNLSSAEDDHVGSPRSHGFPSVGRRQICPVDGSAPARPAILTQTRTHSFRCPDLDTIESSESERESTPSSISDSPGRGSPITASESSFNEHYKHATRIRESIDENVNHYHLQSEFKKAQQRMLQEQALAAFANSDFHEPVRHYVNDDQDSLDLEIEDRPTTWEGFEEDEPVHRPRRESTNTPWEQLEMQRHAEKAEQERRANGVTSPRHDQQSLWWTPTAGLTVHQMDGEMRSMRDRASPPWQGRDIVFPRCPSPEPARFDVTQACETLRQQVSASSHHVDEKKEEDGAGLWTAVAKKQKVQHDPAAAVSTSPEKASPGKGLWGGFCIGQTDECPGGLMPQSGPTGLMTPALRNETVNPFEQSFVQRNSGNASLAPPTPPESVHGADPAQIDVVLTGEREFDEMFEREYPDSFVTQIFNYLSLGYPTMARPFDAELSKISRIPIPELRQDDIKARQDPRGYIRLGPDFEGGGGEGCPAADECMRWHALKLYVREWARQEKDMVRVDAPGGNWATTNRRGSWAW